MKHALLTTAFVLLAGLCAASVYIAWTAVLQSNSSIDQLKLQLLMLHHAMKDQETRQRALEPRIQEQLKAAQDDSAHSTRQFGALVLNVQQSLWDQTASQALFSAATESRFRHLEKSSDQLTDSLKSTAAHLAQNIQDDAARLTKLQSDTDSRLATLSSNLDTSLQSLDTRLKNLDVGQTALQKRIDALPPERIQANAIAAAQAEIKSALDRAAQDQLKKQQEIQAQAMQHLSAYWLVAAQIEDKIRHRDPSQQTWNDEDRRALRQALLDHLIPAALIPFDPPSSQKLHDALRHASQSLTISAQTTPKK